MRTFRSLYAQTVAIDPRVDIGHVHLKVADLDRALGFWRGVLGFEEQAEHFGVVLNAQQGCSKGEGRLAV